MSRLIPDAQGRRIEGLSYSLDGRVHEVAASNLIIAAGAWSIDLVKTLRRVQLPPIIRKKCLILKYPRQLIPVPGITVCLDITKSNGSPSDVTLVPFEEWTLAAGTDWSRLASLDQVAATPEEIDLLRGELGQCFPELRGVPPADHDVCIKTERDTLGDPPDVSCQVYGRRELGIEGLTLAFPGKASFMFALAQQVAAAQQQA